MRPESRDAPPPPPPPREPRARRVDAGRYSPVGDRSALEPDGFSAIVWVCGEVEAAILPPYAPARLRRDQSRGGGGCDERAPSRVPHQRASGDFLTTLLQSPSPSRSDSRTHIQVRPPPCFDSAFKVTGEFQAFGGGGGHISHCFIHLSFKSFDRIHAYAAPILHIQSLWLRT